MELETTRLAALALTGAIACAAGAPNPAPGPTDVPGDGRHAPSRGLSPAAWLRIALGFFVVAAEVLRRFSAAQLASVSSREEPERHRDLLFAWNDALTLGAMVAGGAAACFAVLALAMFVRRRYGPGCFDAIAAMLLALLAWQRFVQGAVSIT